MGPPRERDGKQQANTSDTLSREPQWGRRVNATESSTTRPRALVERASMGPPRERDGKVERGRDVHEPATRLQWGRRVNATESQRVDVDHRSPLRFNGAAA